MNKLLPLALAPLLIGAAPATPKPQSVNLPILHVQVILDKLGFSPGTLDGKRGQSLTLALKGFQESRGLQTTGTIDKATLNALLPFQAWRAVKSVTLNTGDIAGPFTWPFPKEPADQAKLPGLYYKNALEALAERFHTTNATLIALNSPETQLKPGVQIIVPNALPTSRAYSVENKAWRATLNSLNVPCWSGQITQRNNYSLALAEGEGASEYDGRSEAASEIAALWSAIEKSVQAINGAYEGAAMHRVAA